jgi:SAM-dependent methyltransferase
MGVKKMQQRLIEIKNLNIQNRISVDSYNKVFAKYPKLVEDKGWIYGCWYCGTSFTKNKFYGEYPPTFLKRALSLFPYAKDIIHCPSGSLMNVPGVTVDLLRDEIRCPQYQASADDLPFEDNTFDLFLSDPPYSDSDSKIYNTPPFPLGGMLKEAKRILRPGGYLGVLHVYYPSYRRQDFKLIGLITVVTGFQRVTRIFSIFRKL